MASKSSQDTRLQSLFKPSEAKGFWSQNNETGCHVGATEGDALGVLEGLALGLELGLLDGFALGIKLSEGKTEGRALG